MPEANGKRYEDTLVGLGANPINLTVQVKAGEESKRVYPVALVKYKDRQALVNLYGGGKRAIGAEELNSAEALMEYQFAKTLDGLVNPSKPLVAYSIGNGEPTDYQTLICSKHCKKIISYLHLILTNKNLFLIQLKCC